MKANNEWEGKSGNQLKPEYYQTWADYHIKYLDLMKASDISFYAISTGNEPSFAPKLPFIGMNWNASNQGKWLAENLAPTLKKSQHSDVEIHAFDDNRNVLPDYMQQMVSANKEALDYISAIGVHGYFDNEISGDVIDALYTEFGKPVLYTEMCFGVTGPVSSDGPMLGNWTHAEKMISILMDSLQHDVVAYIDWNMVLNMQGGPNYVHNVVDSPIIVNEDFTEIYKQPMFYVMAHFSKFLPIGSRRINTNIVHSNGSDTVKVVTFKRNDDKITVIMYNPHDNETVSVKVIDKLKGSIELLLQPKSLNTLIFT